jgi:lipoate-protein ligase A
MLWRVINSGISRSYLNMAVDEAILEAHAAGEVPPTIRFYGWKPAAVSLGYFQQAAREIDLGKCRSLTIDVVRRLTGGRAVLHAAELTYSVVVREDHPLVPETITASYCYFSQGLLAGLRRLGVDAGLTVPGAAYGQTKRRHTCAACFDASSSYEIAVDGRKLVGSAQVRKNGVILQHGSVLLDFDPCLLASLLSLPSAESRERVAAMLSQRAVALNEIMGREVTWQEVYESMTAAMGPALGVDMQLGHLSEKEQEVAGKLADQKYSRGCWNLLR